MLDGKWAMLGPGGTEVPLDMRVDDAIRRCGGADVFQILQRESAPAYLKPSLPVWTSPVHSGLPIPAAPIP